MTTHRVSVAPARATVPTIGRWIPTAVVPLAYGAVAAGLCALVIESPFWLGMGLLLVVVNLVMPTPLITGSLLLLLGVSQLSRAPSVADPTFYALLAGLHLLYMMGSLARVMPWIGRLELAALRRPCLRFLKVQMTSQGVAVTALFLFDGDGARYAGLSIVAAVWLALLGVLLATGVRRDAATQR